LTKERAQQSSYYKTIKLYVTYTTKEEPEV
jgi:hypothetical protein